MKNLVFSDLPQSVQDKLNQITSNAPENLTVEEHAFLKARRDYLRPEQKSVFQGVLDGTVPALDDKEVENFNAVNEREANKKVAEVTGEPVKPVTVPEKEVKQINPDDHKRDVLVQMAKDAGVLPEGEPTKAELAHALNKHLKGE